MALGTLYIVSTPIGTADDISARALRVLAGADVVVCEELREGERLLKRYGLQKALADLNERWSIACQAAGKPDEAIVHAESAIGILRQQHLSGIRALQHRVARLRRTQGRI